MFKILILVSSFYAISIHAARPFLNSANTGLELSLGTDFPVGQLPNLTNIWSINDFDWAAQNFLNDTAYAWIRYGTGAEYTYKNNLEAFPRVGWRPRVLTAAQQEERVMESMRTTILGNNFSAPIFISPAAAPGLVGGYVPPKRELGLVKGAGTEEILYIPALYAEMSIEEMGQAQLPDQAMFQQFYAQHNRTFNEETLQAAEKAGKKAIVWTVDAPADGAWIYGARFTLPPRTDTTLFTWSFYDELRNMTSLPVIPKGINSVADAKIAVEKGAPAIILSNHGGRHLDGAPSPFQTALRIFDEAPEIFSQTEVMADGGVRYGGDILKFLALGVKAVGLGRSFMYANLYGTKGVERAIQLLKKEMFLDAVNLGLTDLADLDASYLDLDYFRRNQWENMW